MQKWEGWQRKLGGTWKGDGKMIGFTLEDTKKETGHWTKLLCLYMREKCKGKK